MRLEDQYRLLSCAFPRQWRERLSSAFLTTSLVVVPAPGTGVVYSVSTAFGRGWRQGSLASLGCTLGIVAAPSTSALLLHRCR